jgi:hypothetical protein
MRILFLTLAVFSVSLFSLQGDDTPVPMPPVPSPTDPLTVTITGPEMVEVGDLVVLDASTSNADAYVWMLAGGSAKQFAVSKDGQTCYFSAKVPGNYIFHAAMAKTMGKTPALTMVEKVVVVRGTIPGPGPGPGPGPLPPPGPAPLADGKFKLAEYTRTVVLSNVSSDKRSVCSGYAGNYAAVSAQIAAGTLKTLADANAKLKALNTVTAGADITYWQANVFKALNDKLNGLMSAGVIKATAMDDWKEVFSELATGFAAATN